MFNLANYETINQSRAHHLASDRYGFISTSKALSILADHDWHPVSVEESFVRHESKRGFQKHLIRLEQGTRSRGELEVGEAIPQLAFVNSHDLTSLAELMLAYFRKICGNGMIVSTSEVTYKIRHIGNAEERLLTVLGQIVVDAPKVALSLERFQKTVLTDQDQINYAAEAIDLVNDGAKFRMQPTELLSVRRSEDRTSDLWTVFNRVQENVIRGGVARTTLNGKSRKTRAIKSIDRNIEVNRALWALTERTAVNKALLN